MYKIPQHPPFARNERFWEGREMTNGEGYFSSSMASCSQCPAILCLLRLPSPGLKPDPPKGRVMIPGMMFFQHPPFARNERFWEGREATSGEGYISSSLQRQDDAVCNHKSR